ncbi:MAG: hypothetical protein V1495_03020 [Pseudomonadota bacterium]
MPHAENGTKHASSNDVLIEYVVSALLFFLALFALLHISEIGSLAVETEQDSFFAARGEFVGIHAPTPGNRVEGAGDQRIVRTERLYPAIIPFLSRLSDSPSPRFTGETAVPRRGGE